MMEFIIVVLIGINIYLNYTQMEELKALIARVQAGIVNIKDDITRIKEGLPATGGLTAEQVAELKTDLENAVKSVEDLDAEN